MSGVVQNVDPPPPHPPPLVRGEDTLAGWRGRGRGVNILEDARHSSVLYTYKYFVLAAKLPLLVNFLRKADI